MTPNRGFMEEMSSGCLCFVLHGSMPPRPPPPFQNCRVEWGAFPRESSSLGEGQLRRWQTDSLRESDGLRMEKMCDDLRRRRRGKAGESDKAGKPR